MQRLKLIINLFLSLSVLTLIFSCDFNINDSPGPKVSASAKEALSHGTFICEYRIVSNSLNGISIKSIFAEKKYSRQKGFLLLKDIDCCNSQLVIVSSTEPFSTQVSGYDINWNLLGFKSPSPGASIIVKDCKGVLFPDFFPVTIIKIMGKGNSRSFKQIILRKVN